jgi:hypothetical protein
MLGLGKGGTIVVGADHRIVHVWGVAATVDDSAIPEIPNRRRWRLGER